jgi:NCAIR mutase (PurE)-related protein
VNTDQVRDLFKQVASGAVAVDTAVQQLRYQPFDDLGFARVDTHRSLRTGMPEVIYGAGKDPAQIATIAVSIARHGQPVLVTKTGPDAFTTVRAELPDAEFHAAARMITHLPKPEPVRRGQVLVLSGGTSDAPIAAEAELTAHALGAHTSASNDVGVAGLHRLLAQRDQLESADAIIVVAGMEGALPSVVSGLVNRPVIAVPTSVGYGVSLGGIAALLAMLSSCAPGVSVVNIDNGFGAGYQAALVARQAKDTVTT